MFEMISIFVVMFLPMTAKTSCDAMGKPVIFITDSAYHSENRKYVLIHEATHARQMEANGGCVLATMQYIHDRKFRSEMELEGYCAEATAMVKDGKSLLHFTPDDMKFSSYFYFTYQNLPTPKETEAWIRERCPILADST